MQVAIDLHQRFYPRILVTMKSLSREALKRQLHDAGLRATPPRLAALRLLRTADRPLSHAEVVAELASEDWDQATIYRNLVKLVEARLARVATQVAGVTRYEASHPREAPHRHPHFACRSCGVVECMPDAELVIRRGSKWRQAVLQAEWQLVGECPDCRPAACPPASRRRPAKRSASA